MLVSGDTLGSIIPLTVAILTLVATLALSVPSSVEDLRAFRGRLRAGEQIEFAAIRLRRLKARKRREYLRVVKHIQIIIGIALSFLPATWLIGLEGSLHLTAPELRNYCFMNIALLMFVNSYTDYSMDQQIESELEQQENAP